jgi:hypothetical protein
MLLQLWITGETAGELISKEREIRGKIYKQMPNDCEYPAYWVAE